MELFERIYFPLLTTLIKDSTFDVGRVMNMTMIYPFIPEIKQAIVFQDKISRFPGSMYATWNETTKFQRAQVKLLVSLDFPCSVSALL